MRKEIQNTADQRHQTAMERYHANYDNAKYLAATAGLATQTANALIDDALALCGSPYYQVSHRRWNKAARQFLSSF